MITAARSGNLKLFVEGETNTPYVYDLMDLDQDQIPKNLKYAPSNDELVKIDTRYKSDRDAPGESSVMICVRIQKVLGIYKKYSCLLFEQSGVQQ
ncbi:hypothetical protein ABE26_07835 [Cytobacillus firmus]|nr:hypothetical protein [Cytobacillus firmus]